MKSVLVNGKVIAKPSGVSASSTAVCPLGQQGVAQAGAFQTLPWPEETPQHTGSPSCPMVASHHLCRWKEIEA